MAIADGEPMDTTVEKEAELDIPRGIRAGGQPEVPELANSADVGAFKAYDIGKIDERPGEVERIPPNEIAGMGGVRSLESPVTLLKDNLDVTGASHSSADYLPYTLASMSGAGERVPPTIYGSSFDAGVV